MMRNLTRMVILIMMMGMLTIMIQVFHYDDEGDVGSNDEGYDDSKDQR